MIRRSSSKILQVVSETAQAMKRIFGRKAVATQQDAPTLEKAPEVERVVTGRRANRLVRTVLHVAEIAPQLTAKKPFFKAKSGGLYAVKTRSKVVKGVKVDVPECFLRVSKDTRSPKLRKRARRASRQLKQEATNWQNNQKTIAS